MGVPAPEGAIRRRQKETIRGPTTHAALAACSAVSATSCAPSPGGPTAPPDIPKKRLRRAPEALLGVSRGR
eukprot:6658555-Alexandrium_andersonii.AAC.1